MAKRLEEEEAARAAEEERRRKEEEEKLAAEAAMQQKKIREKEKKLLRKERTRLRTVSAPVVSQCMLGLRDDDVETLCMSHNIEQLRDLCLKMESREGTERAEALREACGYGKYVEGTEQAERKSPQPKPQQKPQKNGSIEANGNVLPGSIEKKEKPWAKEEIELLRKGMQKYLKGTSRRWEVISEYIGTGRSVEEILKATKTVLLQKPDSAKAFDSFLEKRKPAQSIASPLSTRDEAGVSSTQGLENNAATKTGTSEETSIKSEDNGNADDVITANGGLDQDVWSAVQERALVQALKTFPKEVSQRWDRVATAVPGKTMNQCKKKFASMKENFRNKRSAV